MGAGVVMLREGFEAALIVAIVLAFLERSGRRDAFRAVWLGTTAALTVSVAAGIALFAVGAELEGAAEELWEGGATIAAAGLLTWMIFWMRRQARSLRRGLEDQVRGALATGSSLALAGVAFVAVLREGVETSLFLFGSFGAADATTSTIGACAGLLAAVALGYGFYRGARRLDLRRFFTVTSALLLLFAAWLLEHGLEELSHVGAVPESQWLVWAAVVVFALPTLWLYFRPAPATRASG